jgi:hypothetical protein
VRNWDLLALQASDQLIQIAVLIFILLVVWIALRFVMRLAQRIFALGCVIIVLIAVVLLILRFFS